MNIFQKIRFAWDILKGFKEGDIFNFWFGTGHYQVRELPIVDGWDQLDPSKMHIVTCDTRHHEIRYESKAYSLVIGTFDDALAANKVLYAIKNHELFDDHTQYYPDEPSEYHVTHDYEAHIKDEKVTEH